MPRITAEEAAKLQADRLKSSLDRVRTGVQRVTVAPGQKAAAKQDKMKQNLIKAIDDGTWAKNVAAVTLQDWQTAMLNKGVNRIAEGIDAAYDKQVAFYKDLFAYQETLQSKVNAMPDLTLEDNINRMTTFVRGMANYRKPA